MTRLTIRLALVCGLALAACGGKADQADGSGGTTDTTEIAAAGDATAETERRDPCTGGLGTCGWSGGVYCPCAEGTFCVGFDHGPNPDEDGPPPYGSCHPAWDICSSGELGPPIECGFAWSAGKGLGEPPYCGDCSDGQICIVDDSYAWNNHCCKLQCAASALGPPCGDDGCGGSCGVCEDGLVCGAVMEGNELAWVCVPTCATWCAQQDFQCGDHEAFGPADLTGGMCACGTCPAGASCTEEGVCCAPDCAGMECGDDGCGGACGNCPPGDACIGGACECVPDCMVDEYISECGTSDGCGGSCGECGEDEVCALADYAEIGVCFNPTESCPGICAEYSAECGQVWSGFVAPDTCNCGDCPDGLGVCLDNACVDIGLVWVAIPGQTYQMGCDSDAWSCSSVEKPMHSVTVATFGILETEVTEAQYATVTGEDPSCDFGAGGGPNSPVECVNWYQARAFCEIVGGRLPTEAEWEYAARGGTTTKYYCGDDPSCLGDIAWYGANSGGHKHDVKGKAPNAFGLYDMLGNVWERVEDCWHGPFSPLDPPGYVGAPDTGYPAWDYDCVGSGRVVRGGNFVNAALDLRVTERLYDKPSDAFDETGFRCARNCVPSCEGKACGEDDGCGGKCGECPIECTGHGECGEGQLCLGEPEAWEPMEVCGICGDVETCQCATPSWPAQYVCATVADCEQNFMCGDQCDDCPVTCPKCVHGWCAYETFDDVMCLCTGCA